MCLCGFPGDAWEQRIHGYQEHGSEVGAPDGKVSESVDGGSGILGIIFLYFYQQRRMAESIILACALLLCAALAFRGVWGMRLAKIQRNIKETLPVLPRIYRLRYRFRTTARYLSLLMVVHVFALSLFSIKFISTRIADDPEDMYPYDYVYLANSQDGQYFDRLERECQAKIYSFPMVRATTWIIRKCRISLRIL